MIFPEFVELRPTCNSIGNIHVLTMMKIFRGFAGLLVCFALVCGPAALGQDNPQASKPPNQPVEDYSGMYSFLRDGEFVQLTIEDAGHVTGFISRFGDLDSDKGEFLDQFFKDGKLEGTKLHFTTDTVHGVWFEFTGTVDRGEGKKVGDEAYYVLNGTLVQHVTGADNKVMSRSRQVGLKSFPQDMGPSREKRD